MKSVLILLVLTTLVSGKGLGSYGSDYSIESPGGQGYGEDNAGLSDYGMEYETKCTPYTDTVPEDRCEYYQEKTCYTTHQESCENMEFQSCRSFVTSNHVRQCFNVTELICSLKETVQYDVIQAAFPVHRCRKVKERVCDTVYVPNYSPKDDFQCVTLSKPKCTTEERVVVDQTCRENVNFDCSQVNDAGEDQEGNAYGDSGMKDHSYGKGGHSHPAPGGQEYPSPGGQDYDRQDYGSESNGGYGATKSSCKKTYDVKCYATPRTVIVQRCEQADEKVCEKMSSRVPLPGEKQVCHDDDKKVCMIEQRHQPKQIKKYVYTKECREVPRRVCENSDTKALAPTCAPVTKKRCSYSPVERCENVPKQHCYRKFVKVQKKKCETVPKRPSYGKQDPVKPMPMDY